MASSIFLISNCFISISHLIDILCALCAYKKLYKIDFDVVARKTIHWTDANWSFAQNVFPLTMFSYMYVRELPCSLVCDCKIDRYTSRQLRLTRASHTWMWCRKQKSQMQSIHAHARQHLSVYCNVECTAMIITRLRCVHRAPTAVSMHLNISFNWIFFICISLGGQHRKYRGNMSEEKERARSTVKKEIESKSKSSEVITHISLRRNQRINEENTIFSAIHSGDKEDGIGSSSRTECTGGETWPRPAAKR